MSSSRKLDHIRICAEKDVECKELNWFKYVHLVHSALPEINLDDIDTSTKVFGKTLNAPIIIAGMTGGHEESLQINKGLAEVVKELGLGMGVGSQRAGLEDESLVRTYTIVREVAPEILLIGNLGGTQLLKTESYIEIVRKAADMIKADAIAIHLNVAQEIFQPEGDKEFKGILSRIIEVSNEVDKPLIIKEVGNGLSIEVVSKLLAANIAGFDVGGAGGTNWILVEMYRLKDKGYEWLADIARTFSQWGIPTAASIVETRYVAHDKLIIATGGIRSGLDVAKALALGADLVGIALPALRYILKSKDALKKYLNKLIYELKVVMMLTGCRTVEDLKKAPIVVTGPLREWIEQRGIDLRDYLYKIRCRR